MVISFHNSCKAAVGDTGVYENLEYEEEESGIYITRLLNREEVTEVIIPEEINGRPVVTILGNFAIPGYEGEQVALRRITIPKTVEGVGSDYYSAFENAAKLEEIIVDPENPYLCSVDGVLYNKEKTVLKAYPANKAEVNYQIPDTVTKLQALAFCFAQNLEVVDIPDSVTEIGTSCFAHSSIKRIEFPKNLEIIESYMCYNCTNLTSVVADINGYINLEAFMNCSNLTDVYLGDNCTSIRGSAFENCTKLSNINLETSKVIALESDVFKNCPSLPKTIKLPGTMRNVIKSTFDEDVQLEFASDNYVEATDEWNQCIFIPVKGEQNYEEAYKVFELTNEEREKVNLTTLKLDKNLMDIAMQRAYEIAVYFSHRRAEVYRGFVWAEGEDERIFMEDTVYRLGLTGKTTFLGENIGYDFYTAEDAITGWMDSTGHKANILGADFTTMGVGAVKTENGYFWVQIFGNDTYTPEITRTNITETREIPVAMSYLNDREGYEGITLSAGSDYWGSMDIGDKIQLRVRSRLLYADATTYLDPSIFQWSSSNEKVATVDENGVVTGVFGGTAEISITLAEGKTRSYTITVNNSLVKGDVNKDGKINLYDALQILKKAIIEGDLTEEERYIMDYNDDNEVNLYDALQFLKQAIIS